MTHSSRLTYAKKYTSLGWSVIPIKKGSKRPAVKSWEKFQNKIPSEKELEKMFSQGVINLT